MKNVLLYPAGTSGSCFYASEILEHARCILIDHPAPEITHLLLDVSSKDTSDLYELLRMLPRTITVIGGNLNMAYLQDYRKLDLLQDPYYLAENAAITAECALQAAAPHLHTTIADSPALILGWGRIGKCLAKLLKSMGCAVTVAARKPQDRALLKALGYNTADFPEIPKILDHFCILFNTVPDLPFSFNGSCIALDLASEPGMAGDSVIPARGLPRKYAPESSGKLIAETILRYRKEGIL